jgi:hypothetical protein
VYRAAAKFQFPVAGLSAAAFADSDPDDAAEPTACAEYPDHGESSNIRGEYFPMPTDSQTDSIDRANRTIVTV